MTTTDRSRDDDEVSALLSFDAFSTAETVTGASYKEDEATLGLGFAMHLDHSQRTQDALSARDDSHHGVTWDDLLRIYTDLGFEVVHERLFTDDQYPDHGVKQEQFLILWHPDGILATAESYGGMDRANTTNVYYNWRPVDQEKWSKYTSSGHYNQHESLGWVWVGNHDAREGLRHKLAQLRANGDFLPTWTERPFLWFPTYMDTKPNAINAAVTAELPEHVRAAITPPTAPR